MTAQVFLCITTRRPVRPKHVVKRIKFLTQISNLIYVIDGLLKYTLRSIIKIFQLILIAII
jgi:hypothetical protein